MGASKNLAIISLATGFLFSWVSVIVAVVGLCITKEVGHEKRDMWMNIAGIVIGLLAWAFWLYVGGV